MGQNEVIEKMVIVEYEISLKSPMQFLDTKIHQFR